MIYGVKVAKRTPSVYHLFLVDDSFIFHGAAIEEIKEVKEILNDYYIIS